MKFRDLFVPKYLHSNPEVRIRFIERIDDKNLISQMSEKDDNQQVRNAAIQRLQQLDQRKGVSAH